MPSQSNTLILTTITSLITGAILSDILAKLLTPKKCNPKALVVTHTLIFIDNSKLTVFLASFKKLAEDCYTNVNSCLSFELSTSTANPLKVLVYERHERAGTFKSDHDILLTLDFDRSKCGVESYDICSWLESDIGHMERW